MSKTLKNLLPFVLFLILSCQHTRIEIVEKSEDGEITARYYIDQDSVKQGVSETYFDRETLFERSNYLNGELSGSRIIYFDNGEPEIEENYENGILQDSFKVYYENGQIELVGKYTDGILNGVIHKYYKSGTLKEVVNFVDNLENGPFTEYRENGRLQWVGAYLNGDNEFGELLKYNEEGILIRKLACDSNAVCRTTWTSEIETGE